MPSPSERIAAVISAYSPSEVKFVAGKPKAGAFTLEAVVTKPLSKSLIESDLKLQAAFEPDIEERWTDDGKYHINSSVDGLWATIKRTCINEYEQVSQRCNATKRKTVDFIRGINIEDKYLPNFLIQTFILIRSGAHEVKSPQEQETYFEQFESLRKNYGKRNR